MLIFHQLVDQSLMAIALISFLGLAYCLVKRKYLAFNIIGPLVFLLEVIYLLMSLTLFWVGLSFQ
ncbi:hypothetical protein [Lactococcus termiticola]|uniref:Uncharacterized protein n=1 Tax=Lactococcus termiticola TaxID=2169526 RepID=A0A2R5HDK9_9LACT|nr:hypothetical protein [Lactococcus termiticola]GBG96174.1 hypothetical protein NtB2_00285 [Lactococcus termiticola]